MSSPSSTARTSRRNFVSTRTCHLCRSLGLSPQGGFGGGETLTQPGSHRRGVLVAAAFQFPLGFGGASLAEELAARPHGATDQHHLVFRLVAFAAARRTGVAFGFVALAAHLFVSVHSPLLRVFSVPSASCRRLPAVGSHGSGCSPGTGARQAPTCRVGWFPRNV